MSYDDASPVQVYTSASPMRAPGLLWRSMCRDLASGRELAWRLFVRDVTAQYRQSLLGVLWAFIPPLVTGLIFIFLQFSNVIDLGNTDIPYPLYVLTGTILWQTFADAVIAPLKSVTKALPMLTKISFPREALVLSAIYSVLFGLLIKGVILVFLFVAFGGHVAAGLLLAPFAVLILVLLGITIGLFLTPIGVLYTDISAALPVVLQMLFFVTPVVYSPPASFPFSLLAVLNPVSPLLIGARDLMTRGVLENVYTFCAVSAGTLIGLMVSGIVYRVAMPIILERTNA